MNSTTTPDAPPDAAPLEPTPAFPQPTPQKAETAPRRGLALFASLALLFALAACVAAVLLWRELSETRRIVNAQTAQSAAALEKMQTQTRQLAGQLGAHDNALNTLRGEQQALHDAVQALQTELRKSASVSQTLIEAEYLLRVAQHRLLLDRDVTGAVSALSTADQLLRANADPMALRVRALLAAELNALASVKQPDISGMALTLNSLTRSVPQLPLAGQKRAASHPARESEMRDWRDVLQNIWSELKGLVTVRYDDKPAMPLIPPQQSYFLYQNLRLQLEAARLNLLRRDAQNFRASLNTARDWLNTYFDTRAPLTAAMLDTLARLEQTDINPPLPEIADTIAAVQRLVDQQTPAAAPPADAAPEAQPGSP
ncbi:MAG: uroporphyrinogen-III C-methyltransferase [Pseudomonadota bacterium]